MQKNLHNTGRKPISVLKKQRSDESEPVDRLSIYLASRAKTKDHSTREKIDSINEALEDLPEDSRNCDEEREKIFLQQFGEDRHGRVRCESRGTTPSMVFGKKSGESVSAVRADLEAKFEAKFEAQKEDFEAQLQKQKEENEARNLGMAAEFMRQMEDLKKEMFSRIEQ